MCVGVCVYEGVRARYVREGVRAVYWSKEIIEKLKL